MRKRLAVGALLLAVGISGCSGSGNAISETTPDLPTISPTATDTTSAGGIATDAMSPGPSGTQTTVAPSSPTTVTPTTGVSSTASASASAPVAGAFHVRNSGWVSTASGGLVTGTWQNQAPTPATVTSVSLSVPGTATVTEPTLSGRRQAKPGGLLIPAGGVVTLTSTGTAVTVALAGSGRPTTVVLTLHLLIGGQPRQLQVPVTMRTAAPTSTAVPGDGATTIG